MAGSFGVEGALIRQTTMQIQRVKKKPRPTTAATEIPTISPVEIPELLFALVLLIVCINARASVLEKLKLDRFPMTVVELIVIAGAQLNKKHRVEVVNGRTLNDNVSSSKYFYATIELTRLLATNTSI